MNFADVESLAEELSDIIGEYFSKRCADRGHLYEVSNALALVTAEILRHSGDDIEMMRAWIDKAIDEQLALNADAE